MNCQTAQCVTVWLPYSPIIAGCFFSFAFVVVWKLIKSLIDTIPLVG